MWWLMIPSGEAPIGGRIREGYDGEEGADRLADGSIEVDSKCGCCSKREKPSPASLCEPLLYCVVSWAFCPYPAGGEVTMRPTCISNEYRGDASGKGRWRAQCESEGNNCECEHVSRTTLHLMQCRVGEHLEKRSHGCSLLYLTPGQPHTLLTPLIEGKKEVNIHSCSGPP